MSADPFVAPAVCVVRGVGASFTRALRREPAELSVDDARAQHAAYVAALRACGARVIELPPDEACPDACFVEDTAVVLRDAALSTRPGAPSRRPEVAAVAQALGTLGGLHAMEDPATLDGGDVLRAGATLFVGLSERTNRAGAARLEQVAAACGLAVVRVPVDAGLHLKSACSLAGASLLVYDAGALDPAPFRAAGLECVAVDEPVGANVLALGPDTVLVSADAPRTADALRARGVGVSVVRVSEFHRADGALTCLSIRWPAAGGWVT